MTDILTITLNPALDVTTAVGELEPHVKLRCEAPLRQPGGGGINVSRMIKELGSDSRAFIAIGGVIGEHLRILVEDEGIECDAFAAPGLTRETLQVVERKTGEQYRFVLPGPQWDEANAHDVEGELDRIIGEGGFKWVVASGSLPPGMPADIYARLAQRARDKGARFILDSSGEALVKGLEAPVFLVKPDRKEVAELARAYRVEEGALEDMARSVVTRGAAEAMIYTRGEKGAVLATGDAIVRWRPPKVQVKSLTGAGDSFIAAVIVSLARGEALETATRWGVAAAAAAAQTEATELAERAEVERLFDQVERDEGSA